MNDYYSKLEDWMKRTYNSSAPVYRKNDEMDALGPDHNRVCKKLRSICLSFGRPITVLDIGCGTGRYFHCLREVDRLVGVDVSSEMLAMAKNPVKGEELAIKQTELILGNAYSMDFPAESFDFVFSIGVFGNGCPVEPEFCNKIHTWLRPGGRFFFDAFDTKDLSLTLRTRLKTRELVYPRMPHSLQQRWDQRSGWLPFYAFSKRQLEKMLRKCGFTEIQSESCVCALDLGAGRKLETVATKL